jgi:protein-S-isoprenylcysteine O-methyltransferase Ste14
MSDPKETLSSSSAPSSSVSAPWPALVRLGHLFFRTRDGLFPALFLVLAFGFRPHWAGGDPALDRLVDVVGLGIAAAGQALRAAVIGFAYIRRGGRNRQIYADELVTEGFFAHCRNPLYVGNLLVLLGLIVVHNSPWFYLIGVPFYLLAYVSITLAEEDFLRGRFKQEYEEYCRRVPRFWIRWGGLGETLAGMDFDWRKLVRKEYGSTFAWITGAIVLLGWQAVANLGWESARSEVMTLILFWIPVLAAYLIARWAKKTGRLGKDAA